MSNLSDECLNAVTTLLLGFLTSPSSVHGYLHLLGNLSLLRHTNKPVEEQSTHNVNHNVHPQQPKVSPSVARIYGKRCEKRICFSDGTI